MTNVNIANPMSINGNITTEADKLALGECIINCVSELTAV